MSPSLVCAGPGGRRFHSQPLRAPPSIPPSPPSSSQLGCFDVFVSKASICDDDELSCDGCQCEPFGFTCCEELVVEGFESWTGSRGAEGHHEQDGFQFMAAAAGVSPGAMVSAFARMRRQAGEACDLTSRDVPQLRQERDEGAGSDRADAGDGPQHFGDRDEFWAGLQGFDPAVEGVDLTVHEGQHGPKHVAHRAAGWGAAAVFGLGALLEQALAVTHQDGQRFTVRIGWGPMRQVHAALLAEPGQPTSICHVSFGVPTMRGDEGFGLGRISPVDGQAERMGGVQNGALIAARDLAHRQIVFTKVSEGLAQGWPAIVHDEASPRFSVVEGDRVLGDIKTEHSELRLDLSGGLGHDGLLASDCLRARTERSGPFKSTSEKKPGRRQTLMTTGESPIPRRSQRRQGDLGGYLGPPSGQPI
jgi:hypothetical protein